MKGIVGAYPHTLPAPDAPLEEARLRQRARGPYQERGVLGREGIPRSKEGNRRYACGQGGQNLSARDVHLLRAGRVLPGSALYGEEPEAESAVGAGGLAVEAEVTFGLVPLLPYDGVIPALAGQQAFVAPATGLLIFLKAEDGEA